MSKNNATKMWAKVRERIARGDFPPVFVTGDGRLALEGSAATLPPDIAASFPPEIRAAAEAKAAARREEAFAAEEMRKAERAAVQAEIDRLRHVRCWRLGGLFIEDASMARYTLAEIEAWVRWDSPNLHAKHPTVTAETDDDSPLTIDLSGYFQEVCGGRCPSTLDADMLCRRLAAYVQERCELVSANN